MKKDFGRYSKKLISVVLSRPSSSESSIRTLNVIVVSRHQDSS